MNSRKQVISLIVFSLVVLVIFGTCTALVYQKYMSGPAREERTKEGKANAKRVAATIAVFPSPLPDHLAFWQAVELNDRRALTIASTTDEYPIIEITVSPKIVDEDTKIDALVRKITGFEEYKSGTLTFCEKSLPYCLGHNDFDGTRTDLLVGRIVDWTPDEMLDVRVTTKVDSFDLARIEAFFASIKPTSTLIEKAAFTPNEILSSVKSQLLSKTGPGWAASGVIAIAGTEAGAKQIALMIKKNQSESSYTVIFPGDEQVYAISDEDIAQRKVELPLWSKVLGCAIEKKFPNQEGVYGTPDAWQPAVQTVLEALTGSKIRTTRLDEVGEAELAKMLEEEMQEHHAVLFSTKGSGELTEFSSVLRQNAAYPVLAYDAEKRVISVPKRDLLKSAQKLSEDESDQNKEIAKVSLKELRQFGRFISFPER